MLEIVRYISRELQNPDAADRLAVELIDAVEGVLHFPYATPALPADPSLEARIQKNFGAKLSDVLLGR